MEMLTAIISGWPSDGGPFSFPYIFLPYIFRQKNVDNDIYVSFIIRKQRL